MKNILLAAGFILAITSQAQITITSANQLTPGNQFVQGWKGQNFSPTVLPGSAGPSQTWNFSSAGYDFLDTNNTLAASWIPSAFTAPFPQCNIAIGYGSDNTYYDLTTINSNGMSLVGSVRNDAQFGMLYQHYQNPMLYMTWPLAYGSSWVDTTISDYTYPTMPVGDSARDVTTMVWDNEVDAWGTMTLAIGTYSVMRMHRMVSIDVQSYVYTSAGGWAGPYPFTATFEQYQWWTDSPGIGWPIATVDWNASGGSVNSYSTMISNTVGMNDHVLISPAVNVFPNPADDRITLHATGQWEMFNVNGETVKSGVAIGTSDIDVAELASGIYILGVTDEEGIRSTTRIVIRH